MTSSEVCKSLGLTYDALRYYERVGLMIPPPRRKANGARDYNELDCFILSWIKNMRDIGISIERLREFVNLFVQGPETRDRRLDILLTQRSLMVEKIESLQKNIERIDDEIEKYQTGQIHEREKGYFVKVRERESAV